MTRPTARVVTDGTAAGTRIFIDNDADLLTQEGMLRNATSVRTTKDGRNIEVVQTYRLTDLQGAQHPFELTI